MASAIPVFYEIFARDLAAAVHDLANDPLGLALTNLPPNHVLHESRADIGEITSGNGYGVDGVVFPPQTLTRVGRGANLTIPGTYLNTTGALPTWRWGVLFNTTNGRLILSWDYGAPGVAMAGGQSMEIVPEDIPLSVGIVPGIV
jgi:hypothetical protein